MAITIYHMPASCSRVTLNALEEAGVDYADRTVALLTGGQNTPAYLAINPKGKVPALVVDGITITENPAIILHLHTACPDAALLPSTGSSVFDMRGLSDLIWCAATLHPMVQRFVRPEKFTDGPPEPVKAIAQTLLDGTMASVAERVSGGRWWYGEMWSIVDVYLNWIFSSAATFGYPDVPAELVAHRQRVEARPSFQRARLRELAALARDGVDVLPGTMP